MSPDAATTAHGALRLRAVTPAHFPEYRAGLQALLRDSVAGGASVGFLNDPPEAQLDAYWSEVAAGLASGQLRLWVALEDGVVLGSVQLALASKPNGLNRAEVQKLLVARVARRRGLARQLMAALEQAALDLGRGLLFLDTLAGSEAEHLYQALGYQRAGEIPDYAAAPDGRYHPTALYYKRLRSPA
ncbi:GNAT family N-acetyltransferase [Pseudomonas mangiferae]|uniref:GNAT family N-acetyltransferase n=1 Tax=Pseudomonas mangiferae TaxID=2593654 RepID=A0A553GWT1_9PSED|nr:GNAT family N-acetyltransferase [Pseudomonas mangiferae]TRX73960.1 GNAT family N-acetyltransferase [Pseudomonas mangiferae]